MIDAPRHVALKAAVLLSAAVAAFAAGEAILRFQDGYSLTSFALRRQTMSVPAADPAAAADRYLDTLPIASGVDRTWYRQEPEPSQRIPLDAALADRADRYKTDSIAPFFSFNRRYLQEQVCGSSHGAVLPPLNDFFYFEPTVASAYPSYRHLRHASPPGWFVTNNFGWRGPDVDLRRRPNVIRIAFVGASTTIDNYGVPFSHPELVGYWLNKWASATGQSFSFEVVNAGRSGIDSRSIAAVVRQEVVPIDPDLVIFYEGANQFWPGQMMTVRFGRLFPKPNPTARRRLVAENYSVAVKRAVDVIDRVIGGNGREPLKPPYAANWPATLDEHDPDLNAAALPMDLNRVLVDLADMRDAVKSTGGELAVSSFIWLVYDGMRLDLARHLSIYRYLSENYWPIPYAHMRRMADFQNRVFEKFARANGLPFIDVARDFPLDPDLFGDAIHMKYPGLRLQAWLYVQLLLPIITAHTNSGQWPRPVIQQTTVHPAFDQPDRRLVTMSELKAGCS